MYPVTILLSCIVIGEVLGDCPHSQFIQNSICDDCRGWKEVRNIVRFFLHILFSHIPFLCKDCYIPFQCSLHSYRTLCIFLLQAFYIPIQGPLYFSPCSLYYYQCFFLLSKTLCCAISRTSYTYSRSFLSKFIVLLVPFQHSFNSSLMSFIYLPNSFYYQPMIYFILI